MEDYTTCEISDALIKLGSKHGGLLPDILCISPPASSLNKPEEGRTYTRIEGPAYTVKMVPFHDTQSPKPQAHFVDAAKEGHVIVIQAPQSVKSAVWGGLMSYGAKARGAVGVVIEGRCRDVLEHQQAGFPVFSKGQSTLGQKPFTRPSELDVPLELGGEGEWPSVLVHPGDWIVADVDGVVVIPYGQMQKVRDLCKTSREIDEKCRVDIAAGMGIQETFKKYR
ncbi:RraA-like protein, partial [Serendipita vermifera]